jgi:hypothetical protein
VSFAAATAWAEPRAQTGDKAPPLNAGSWLNLPEGMKTLKAKDLTGQILFVEFWATW